MNINWVGSEPGYTYARSAIKLSLAGITGTITYATFKFYVVDVQGAPVVNLISTTDESWNETDPSPAFPTYNSAGIVYDSTIGPTAPYSNVPVTSSGWKEFNVKDYIQSCVDAGKTDVIFVLTGTEGSGTNDDFNFVSNQDSNTNLWSKLDLTYTPAPTPPSVTGAGYTNNTMPTWSWTAGGGGNGTFQYKLDNNDLTSGATTTTSLGYTPGSALSEGPHTLYVQESNGASPARWSNSGSFTIVVDITPPTAPAVIGTSPTNSVTPTWTWSSGGGGDGNYRYKLDDSDLSSGTTATTSPSYTPGSALSEGSHTLYVQEKDAAGNWSSSGSISIIMDVTPPDAPTVTGATPTNDNTPTWTWSSGGEGDGNYRYKLDDSDLSSGTTATTSPIYTPGSALSEGSHTLYVQEKDAAGNWSSSGSFTIVINTTAPVQTATPTITGTPTAGATSVSGTAVAGASVVLSVNGTAKPAVTADGSGNWTISGLTLATGDAISVTAQSTGETVSNAATATVAAAPVPVQTATPTIMGTPTAGNTSVSGTTVAGASVVLSVNGTAKPAVTADGSGNWTVSGLTLASGDTISVTAQATGETVSNAATATVAAVAVVTIDTAAIAGVTAPVTGATPVSTIAATSEYIATIAWSPADTTFAPSTVYTVTITLTPKAGYTLTGVSTNFFTVAGATTTNSAGSGVVTAVFPTNVAVPTINTQPSNQTVNVGGTANLSITASGGVVLSYQWYSNTVNSTTGGAIISGAASGSYSAPTDAEGTKYYYCVVTNTDSGATGNQTATATSNVATVTVNAAPTHGGGGGGGSPTPSPTPTTVTGSVIDGNGTQVSNVTATVTADSNGNFTVSMNVAQTVMLKQPDGTKSSLSDLSKVTFATAAGSPVTVSDDGTINLTRLVKGTDNNFNITYDLGNGQTITIGTMDVTVSSNGAVSLTCTLIDPYGVIIDAATGKPIAEANVTLYYANTERNKTDGKTPDTVVPLPGINGFKPNNNLNPQLSDASGAYGFMVFPTTDYYIVATKNGYNNYTSPTISVEQDIVKWDFRMNQPTSGLTRLSGLTSVDTALVIAKANCTGEVANVILATVDNYPDAIAGSVLAYKLNAPILLVGSSDADQEKILDYMKDTMNPAGTVYILGGTAVVSSAMEGKVTASGFANITRLGGTDRYETSVKIADQLKAKTGTPIVLAYGDNYPDALSISSIAAEMQYPILLVQKDGLSDVVKNKIAEIKPTKVYIIGGDGVISATVESQVTQITSLGKTNIVRIAGADRYETSLAVVKYFDLSGQSVCIATGNNFPDALAGSVYAANHNAPIILADGSLSDQVMTYLKDKKLIGATLCGGEAVVSKDIERQLGQLMGK
ncbi:cell wall-binding protein [Desulfosporosinus fructosivorans]|uniref:Cell wall-binding protein n=2 Tax=Desulfosporosinus fructosivorans TaxID=2018669 RepID=A0A4Z0RAF0_9FIRM|nr:cell wall-binding protein [Desulfosporosinus fructosivorans]